MFLCAGEHRRVDSPVGATEQRGHRTHGARLSIGYLRRQRAANVFAARPTVRDVLVEFPDGEVLDNALEVDNVRTQDVLDRSRFCVRKIDLHVCKTQKPTCSKLTTPRLLKDGFRKRTMQIIGANSTM